MPQQNKRRINARYKITAIRDGKVLRSEEREGRSAREAASGSTIFFINVPDNAATELGVPYRQSFQASIEIEWLGNLPRKKYTREERAARAAAREAAKVERQKAEDAWSRKREAEEEQALLARRRRIINEIELAFEKHNKDAMHFVVCDICSKKAAYLLVAVEPEGSTIPFEHITGARCQDHYWRSFKTNAAVRCASLEFFYDGVRQLYINKQESSVAEPKEA